MAGAMTMRIEANLEQSTAASAAACRRECHARRGFRSRGISVMQDALEVKEQKGDQRSSPWKQA